MTNLGLSLRYVVLRSMVSHSSERAYVLYTHRYLYYNEVKQNPDKLSDFFLIEWFADFFEYPDVSFQDRLRILEVLLKWVEVGIYHQSLPTQQQFEEIINSIRNFVQSQEQGFRDSGFFIKYQELSSQIHAELDKLKYPELDPSLLM